MKIFLNYRRQDTLATACRLHESLSDAFGSNCVFIDVDQIPTATNFHEVIANHLENSTCLLCLIGERWTNLRSDRGTRRIFEPDDYVALEVGEALARQLPVIPLLIDGAEMPAERDLPPTLRPLASIQATSLSSRHFRRDFSALKTALTSLHKKNRGLQSPPRMNLIGYLSKRILGVTSPNAQKAAEVTSSAEPLSIALDAKANSTPAETPQELLRGLKAAYLDGDRQGALAIANSGMSAFSDNLYWLRHAGEALADLDQHAEAVEAFDKAHKLAPDDTDILYMQARSMHELRRFEQALALCSRVIELRPLDQDAYYLRGIVLDDLKRFDEAISDQSEAIRLAPNFSLAYHNRAVSHQNKGDLQAARRDYQMAIELDPDDVDAKYALKTLNTFTR